MLTLRKDQYACFAAEELRHFKIELREHLVATFPLQTAPARPEALDAYVDLAVDQARETGIDTRASVQSFADHMVLLGAGFQVNPLYAGITEPLRDPELISPVQRMDLVYDRAWDYLDRTRGPDGRQLIKAMGRLRAMLSLRGERWGDGIDDLLATLERIFPQKAAAHDRQTLIAFVEQTLRQAHADDFRQPPARTLYLSIAFLTGIGFFADPLVRAGAPEHAAELTHETDPRRRTALLGGGAIAYLDQSLERLRDMPGAAGG